MVLGETIAALVMQVVKSILPETPEDKLRAIELSIRQQELSQELAKGQIQVNEAEASQPNRKWVTWRELLGYMLVIAISWQWLVVPFLAAIWLIAGHPLDVTKLPQIEMLDVLYLLGGILGLDLGPIVANKVRGKK